MKITMPSVPKEDVLKSKDMLECKLYLCKNKEDGQVVTVVVHANRSAIFFGERITWLGDIDDGWFDENFTIIRKYQSGDKLVVEV